MSKIDHEQVSAIARLARLALSESDNARYGTDLSRILEYMDQLNELDTDGIEPTAHPLDVRNVWRGDEAEASYDAERALANAPVRDGEYFLVPRVLDQGDSAG